MMTATSDVAKKEANDIQDKLNAVVTKLEKHDNSLFTDNGKLKTGLSCLHKFNAGQRHSIIKVSSRFKRSASCRRPG